MPWMEWDDTLRTGIDVFDHDHKTLVNMVNALYDAVDAGKARDAMADILDGLIEYTKTHFAREEDLMSKHGYPDLATHRREHQVLTDQVLRVQAKYHGGATETLSLEVLIFLKNWLLRHIQGTDRRYGPFFNGIAVH